jgi:hypothetical protein
MDDLQPSFITGNPFVSIADNAYFKSFIGDLSFNSITEDPSFGFVTDGPLLNPIMSSLAFSGAPRTTLGQSDLERIVESIGNTSKFVPLIFPSRSSNLTIDANEENIQAIYRHLRNFTLERQEGELPEDIRAIFGPIYKDELLHFLNHTINLVSNNLLLEGQINKIVQWVNEIQGEERLLASLLFINSPIIKAFASKLFTGALQVNNALIIRIILQARAVDPNLAIKYSKIISL